jgi:hypothetical protein
VVYVAITPEYRKVVENQFKIIEQKFASTISMANSDELDRILDGLSTLKNRITEYYEA